MVDEQLDDLIIVFFEKLEQVQSKRAKINELMRDGNLNISKSRYSMGNKSVGEIQFSHKMAHALYHIATMEGDNGAAIFELEKYFPGTIIKNVDPEDSFDRASMIRRRKVGPKETENLTSRVEDLNTSKASNEGLKETERTLENQEKIEDPIKWFGVLVPSSLRNAQKNYQEVIELCCDVTNLETELRQTIQEFRVMKAKKTESKDQMV